MAVIIVLGRVFGEMAALLSKMIAAQNHRRVVEVIMQHPVISVLRAMVHPGVMEIVNG